MQPSGSYNKKPTQPKEPTSIKPKKSSLYPNPKLNLDPKQTPSLNHALTLTHELLDFQFNLLCTSIAQQLETLESAFNASMAKVATTRKSKALSEADDRNEKVFEQVREVVWKMLQVSRETTERKFGGILKGLEEGEERGDEGNEDLGMGDVQEDDVDPFSMTDEQWERYCAENYEGKD